MENKIKAVAYYRTSSSANVGEDKDSLKRQQESVNRYSALNNIEIVREFYDPAVKGSDDLFVRKSFAELLDFITKNNITTILIETANRFARDVVIQITGYEYLKKIGVSLVPVDAPAYFAEDTASAEMIRGVFAVISKFEKRSLVERMRRARDRKRLENGRCEGRKPPCEEAVVMAKKLRSGGMSYRGIAHELSSAGYRVLKKDSVTKKIVTSDKVYGPQSVRKMIGEK